MGFTFINRTSSHMNIDARGTKEAHRLLNIIEFDSTRKRMSVRATETHHACVCVCVCLCLCV